MVYENWQKAVAAIESYTALVTNQQKELAGLARLTIPDETPQLVAAALLRSALTTELNLADPKPVSEYQHSLIEVLLQPGDIYFSPSSDIEATAWITHLRLVRRRECLEDTKLVQGDTVETINGEVAEVSSIADDGRVFFRGGKGFGAWPDQISVIARVGDRSKEARDARRQANNTAARLASRSDWSSVKMRDLREFVIENSVSKEDIADLEPTSITLLTNKRYRSTCR